MYFHQTHTHIHKHTPWQHRATLIGTDCLSGTFSMLQVPLVIDYLIKLWSWLWFFCPHAQQRYWHTLCLNWQFAAALHYFQNQLVISTDDQTKQQTRVISYSKQSAGNKTDFNLQHNFVYPSILNVFNQIQPESQPWLYWSFVLSCLVLLT